jgi:hypothetical protein
LKQQEVDAFSCFFIALAVGILSPQYHKIGLGHFALSYTFVVPLAILLLLNFVRHRSTAGILKIIFFNIFLFFIHPYVGMSVSIFSFFTLVFFVLSTFPKNVWRGISAAAAAGVIPVLFFKIFMLFTDHHPLRPTEPFGIGNWDTSVGGLFVPNFGPFQQFLKVLLGTEPGNFEGWCYLGIAQITLLLLFILTLPLSFRSLKIESILLALFVASLVLLFLAFGLHNRLLAYFDIHLTMLEQFRATGRFAWFFYYMLPLTLLPLIYRSVQLKFPGNRSAFPLRLAAILFFLLNLLEANELFKIDRDHLWKHRNFFNPALLTIHEKKIIDHAAHRHPQAILPLRIFNGGSEMYERPGFYSSMPPSLLFSYHCKLPIASTFLSRTSIPETEDEIEILNSYKKNRPALEKFTSAPLLVIKADKDLFPDERRILKQVHFFEETDSLAFGYLSAADLEKPGMDDDILELRSGRSADTARVVYIPSEPRRPFTVGNIKDFEVMYILDSNHLASGRYNVSFHYHYSEKKYKSVANNLTITRTLNKDYEWQYNPTLRVMSGFYPGFGVFEYEFELRKECRYEFLLKGYFDQEYAVSSFLLRPYDKTVMLVTGQDTSINNFPR